MITDLLYNRKEAASVSVVAAKAFVEGKDFRRGNVEVIDGVLYLHGSALARRTEDGQIEITNAGYGTPTTRRYLNALMDELGVGYRTYQHKNEQYLSDDVWDGDWAGLDMSRPETLAYIKEHGVDPADPSSQQLLEALLGAPDEQSRDVIMDYWLESGGQVLGLV